MTYDQDYRDSAVAQTTGPLTIKEAAEVFEVSAGALWRWRKQAGLTRAKKQPPACHPARPHYAKRMCKLCYYAEYRTQSRRVLLSLYYHGETGVQVPRKINHKSRLEGPQVRNFRRTIPAMNRNERES